MTEYFPATTRTMYEFATAMQCGGRRTDRVLNRWLDDEGSRYATFELATQKIG